MSNLLQKEAVVWADAWERLKDFFRPEARRAKKDVSDHFSSESQSKWDTFVRNAANSPEFIKQLKRSKKSDGKLVQHAIGMAELQNGRLLGTVESQNDSGKKYEVRSLPGGQLGCTCNDWRFKGSVTPGYKCKHLRAYEDGKAKVSEFRARTMAFFDELGKIHDQARANASIAVDGKEDRARPHDNTLTQGDEETYYNPRPATSPEDPEVIVGGNH